MKSVSVIAAIMLVVQAPIVASFSPSVRPVVVSMASAATKTSTTTAISMAKDDEDLLRFARQSRSAGSDDNVVELMKPLGLVLNQDDDNNVYVETVAPRGNAARTGKVKEGDYVTMCSATFGDQMWSTRGVGLSRVLAAIRVRAGPTVSS
jgi:C-terminal processing protease CtpA/Prc